MDPLRRLEKLVAWEQSIANGKEFKGQADTHLHFEGLYACVQYTSSDYEALIWSLKLI